MFYIEFVYLLFPGPPRFFFFCALILNCLTSSRPAVIFQSFSYDIILTSLSVLTTFSTHCHSSDLIYIANAYIFICGI